jgi:hypothetical protein
MPAALMLRTPGPKPLRSGVMDIQASPNDLDVADSPAQAIRTIREEGFDPAATATRMNLYHSNGLWAIPCIHTAYSTTNAYVNDLLAFLNGLNAATAPYIELGNEPGTGGAGNTEAEKQANRDVYLGRLFTAATSGAANGKRAVDVVHESGRRTILAAMTAKIGGFGPVANDIDAGSQGSTWAELDAVCFHPYAQEGVDVRNTLVSNRGSVDAHAGAKGKPMFVTEVGWCAETRADGTQPGSPNDWNDQPQAQRTWLSELRVIQQGEQADKVSKADNTGVWNRLANQRDAHDLRLLALCWFGHQDYGLPTSGHFNHCGLLDWLNAKRTAWGRLNAQPRHLAVAHYNA